MPGTVESGKGKIWKTPSGLVSGCLSRGRLSTTDAERRAPTAFSTSSKVEVFDLRPRGLAPPTEGAPAARLCPTESVEGGVTVAPRGGVCRRKD